MKKKRILRQALATNKHQNRSNGCIYGDLTVFKTAAVSHLKFLKFKFFTVGTVDRRTLRHHTKIS